MVELKGSLETIGLPAIVQLLEELHRSGTLELTDGASSAILGFDDGRLVSAVSDSDEGAAALARVGRELTRGEFRFLEGSAAGERTLDLSGAEVQEQLAHLLGRPFAEPVMADVALSSADPSMRKTCPRLGFADDPSHTYSRPTALHRCFAIGARGLVTIQEQSELCLSGRYASCARYDGSASPPANGHVVHDPPTAHGTTSLTRKPSSPEFASTTTPAAVQPPPSVPRGVERRPVARPLTAAIPSVSKRSSTPPAGVEPADSTQRSSPRLVGLLGGLLALAVIAAAVLLATRLLPTSNLAGPNASATTSAPPDRTAAASASTPAGGDPPPSSTAVIPAPNSAGAVSPRSPLVNFSADTTSPWVENAPYAMRVGGAYRLTAAQPGRFVAVAAPADQTLSDAVVSATMRKTGGPSGGGVGIVLRAQSAAPLDGANQTFRGYVFEAGDKGEFGIWIRDNDRWIDVVSWTPMNAIRTGAATNELTVRATGTQFVFTINGAEVADIRDASLKSGGIGVFVGGDANEVAVDQFAVTALN